MRAIIPVTSLVFVACSGGVGVVGDAPADQPEDIMDAEVDTIIDSTADTMIDSTADSPDDSATDTTTDATADTTIDPAADAMTDDPIGDGECPGTWIDHTTGYVWENPPLGAYGSWVESVAYCNELSLCGHDAGEWHLPTIGELRSLIRGCPGTVTDGTCDVTDTCLHESCLDPDCYSCSPLEGPGSGGCYWDPAVEGLCTWAWSSSWYHTYPDLGWLVEFDTGNVNRRDMTHNIYVRCVRPGP